MSDKELQNQRSRKEYRSDLGETSTQIVTLPGIKTQSGYQFESINISYQTLGTLSPKKDNVILVCHALSGTAHMAGINPNTGRPGWWDNHIGPGKSIDTDKFFVICTNILGGCNGSTGPSSIDPKTGKPFGITFPLITIRDMVKTQKMFLDHLGIERLFSVLGGSMGGMQSLVWAIDYPDRVQTCMPIASCMAQNAMQIAFSEVGRQAILNDPDWDEGRYSPDKIPEHGLSVARMVAHITYLSKFSMQQKFGRKIQREAIDGGIPFPLFSVESYLHYQGGSFVKRFDPNTYLYITKAMNVFDLLEGKPAMDVFREIQARFLVISFESDWLYPPAQSRELVRALKRASVKVTYANLETPYGHDSFLIKNPEFTRITRNFLNSEYLRISQPEGGELAAS